MELVTGAMGSLVSKLCGLLKEEYKLETKVKDQVRSLALELESANAALRKVAGVPPDELDELVRIWAREVREASYNMEDILDTFLVHGHVEGACKPADQGCLLKRLAKNMARLFHKCKERHNIYGAVENIKMKLQEVTERRDRYTINGNVSMRATPSRTVDPRLAAMYKEAAQIIGMDESMAHFLSMLSYPGGNESKNKMKIVSVVGVGGLGKTTLAKAAYEKLQPQFDCGAFVPVGRNPDLKKVLRDILIDLDKKVFKDTELTILDERQLINKLRDFLGAKRYFIVIDDVWEKQSWEVIQLAFVEYNNGSRVITTSRKLEVGAGEVFKLQPLSHNYSKKLFYTRIFGGEDKCQDSQLHKASDKILKKCGGVPLAIITMASLLVGKSREEWLEVCKSIGFRDKDNEQVDDTMWILSLSYYDLPPHLKTCLLYLSAFPEDYYIDKDTLIWMWIAEGFVDKKPGLRLFEVGEGYFNDLINRSIIQAVNFNNVHDIIDGCRVHDMVLDLIRSLSHEENFFIMLDDSEGTSLQNPVRRLSFQIVTLERIHKENLRQVRSFIAFGGIFDKKFWLQSFKHLRVLALEHCRYSEGCNDLKHLGSLLHLRYFGLRYTRINKLPEEIESLKFLQTLDLNRTNISRLPRSVGKLTQLVCLRAWRISAPYGIVGKLTSLEELQIYPPQNENSRRQFVEDLGNLRELRVLKTYTPTVLFEKMGVGLLKSLGNLQKMQHLTLDGFVWLNSLNIQDWDAAVLSRHLRHLFLSFINFTRLPSCINPSGISSLTHLEIHVYHMDEQDLKVLGSLPELRHLKLSTGQLIKLSTRCAATLTNVAANGCFQKLRSFVLSNSMVQFVLNENSSGVSFSIWNAHSNMSFGTEQKAVMPNLEELEFKVHVQSLMRRSGSCYFLGLEYLSSLERVKVHFDCSHAFADEVTEVEDELSNTIHVHPSRPTLEVHLENKDKIISGGGEISSIGIDDITDPRDRKRRRTTQWQLPLESFQFDSTQQ